MVENLRNCGVAVERAWMETASVIDAAECEVFQAPTHASHSVMLHYGNIDNNVYVARNNLGIPGFHTSVFTPDYAVLLSLVENLVVVTNFRTIRCVNSNTLIRPIYLVLGVDEVCLESIPDNNLVIENTGAVQTLNDFVNDNPPSAKLFSQQVD